MSKNRNQGYIPALREQKRMENSQSYVDQQGHLHIPQMLDKPVKVGRKHPYYFIFHNDTVMVRALQNAGGYVEKKIYRIIEKYLGE